MCDGDFALIGIFGGVASEVLAGGEEAADGSEGGGQVSSDEGIVASVGGVMGELCAEAFGGFVGFGEDEES